MPVSMADHPLSQARVVVGLPDGLHMRPLSIFSRAAQGYVADVCLRKGDLTADAKRPLELMTLAAEHGEELWIEAHGADAEAAVARLASLFARNFEEDAE